MADDKKDSKKSLVVFNAGPATHHLKALIVPDGQDKEGNPRTKTVHRVLGPNSSIEALDQAEFDNLLGYRHLKDASKMVPHQTARIEELQARIKELEDQNAELHALVDDSKGGKKK